MHTKSDQWLFRDQRKEERKLYSNNEMIQFCVINIKQCIRWSANLLDVFKWCWIIKKIKWNILNSEEELKHWRIQVNEKSEKNNEQFYKVRRSNLKQSLRIYSQSADFVRQIYNKWRDNDN